MLWTIHDTKKRTYKEYEFYSDTELQVGLDIYTISVSLKKDSNKWMLASNFQNLNIFIVPKDKYSSIDCKTVLELAEKMFNEELQSRIKMYSEVLENTSRIGSRIVNYKRIPVSSKEV